MPTTIIETERLVLRELLPGDLDALAAIYADPVTMATMGGPKSRETTTLQIERIRERYVEWGYGLWATVLRETGALIGRCGLIRWPVEGTDVIEVGYLLHHPYWHRGYATEAAVAIRDDAFRTFAPPRVISLIWDRNPASQAVARRNGMRNTHRPYHIVDGMHHEIWEITAAEWRALSAAPPPSCP